MVNEDNKIVRSVIVGGNVDKSVINIAPVKTITVTNQSGEVTKADIQQILQTLQALHDALEVATIDTDIREIVNSDIQEVAQQLEKPELKQAIILPKVKAIMETITATAAACQAWPSIVKMAESLFESVSKLFGA